MFNKKFGIITLIFFLVWMIAGYFTLNVNATSTVLLAVEGQITDGHLVKFKGFNGVGEDTGLAATNVVKCNFAAVAAPTVNNDVDEGYTVGSRWLDVTNDKSYICVDNSDGAAIWHLDVVGPGASTDHAIVRWDSTTGRTVLNSVVTVSDAGVIAGGEWQGTVISPIYGGTGITNNIASTLTITGAFATTITVTGVTGVTFPEAGTLCVTTGTPETTFQIDDDNTGPKLKNSAGEMQVRNAANDAYADLRASLFYGDGSNLTGVGAAAATALTISCKAAENIDKGEVVYISGATGPSAEVNLADNTHTDKHFFCGVAAETKTTGQTILIRVRGELTGFNTMAWTEGDIMYLSTAGTMTNVKPTNGAVEVIGYITYDHAAGSMVILHHSAHGIHVPSTDDIAIRMGDDVGANKVEFKNYSNTVLGSIDSYGRIVFGALGSELAVVANTYGAVLFYFGDNADVTALRSRAVLKTTDAPTKSAQGAVLQASNEDNIDVFVLQGALIEAIGKSDANASTITHMRGALIGSEWSAFDTVTNLKTLYVRTHTRNSAGAGSVSGTGYLVYLENEAVGGVGQQLDAGIYLKATNVSTPKAFDYGIDLSGATGEIATADIKLSEGSTISDNAATGITVVPIAGYVSLEYIRAIDGDGLKLYEDGGLGFHITDGGEIYINNDIVIDAESGTSYNQFSIVTTDINESTLLTLKPLGTPVLDDYGLTNLGTGIRLYGAADGTPGAFLGTELAGDFVVSTVSDAGIRFMPNEATRMYIDKDGNIYMGDGVWTNYIYVTAAGALSTEGTATITADLTGNADTVTFIDNDAENEENEILFAGNAAASGNCVVEADSDFTYNPSTGTLSVTVLDLTTVLSATEGGTGIANAAGETITITGGFALNLTLTAGTGVTLPISGILATLAGTETFTNKTLTTPVINYNVTSSATTNTLTVAESGLVLVSDTHTETLPTAVGNSGLIYIIKKTDDDTDLITIDADGTETIDGELTYIELYYKNAYVWLISDNSNWQIIEESTVKGGTF